MDLNGENWRILVGDCREGMARLDAETVDAVVTDPPYELGFMGAKWDASGIAYQVDVWREAWRVAKPGAWLVAFGASRNYHRMAVAIEDAGWEIRDSLMWLYSSGFPKSVQAGAAVDRKLGATRKVVGYRMGIRGAEGTGYENAMPAKIPGVPTVQVQIPITAPATDEAAQWEGWGTALKPAHEPIVLARKPMSGTLADNLLRHGTGAINVDACRVDMGEEYDPTKIQRQRSKGTNAIGSAFGAGGLVGKEIPTYHEGGRWPANVLHDGSPDVLGVLGDAASCFFSAKAQAEDRDQGLEGWRKERTGAMSATRDGSMLTGSGNERTTTRANIHPTVKPTDLMRYLVRLVTPPGGLVLDPFTGSGSTGKAATLEGARFVGTELDPAFAEIAAARIAWAVDERRRLAGLEAPIRGTAGVVQLSIFPDAAAGG